MRKIKLNTVYRFGKSIIQQRRWVTALVIAVLLAVCFSPLFAIRNIQVNGNEDIASEEILSDLKLKKKQNLFIFLAKNLLNKPEVDPRISTLDIYVEWPDGIRIEVQERRVIAYISYMGTYLCIDSAGYVVNTTHILKENMPVISGIDITEYQLGSPFSADSTEYTDIIITLCSSLVEKGLNDRVVRIDMLDTDNIRLYTSNLEIRFGSEEKLEVKAEALRLILENEPDISGILHLEDITGQVYLEASA